MVTKVAISLKLDLTVCYAHNQFEDIIRSTIMVVVIFLVRETANKTEELECFYSSTVCSS